MLKSYWDDVPSRSLLGWRLPLQRHGGFLTDSGFQNARSHFDQAFKDTMSCWKNKDADDFISYRKLRDRQLTGMDRPSSIVEEGNTFKVVMDVHGFIDNDLKVTFLNDKELIVEGLIEKKNEGSFSRQSFKRRFSFPGNVIVNSACSTLSSDNILTITVNKQAQQITHEENKSSTQQTQSSICGRAATDTNENAFTSGRNIESKLASLMEFPITRRNDFFADSFFDNDRSLFKSRVSEIMNRRAVRDSFDDFSSFRSLRDKDEQNIAVTVTGDTKEHKIILDVHGFNEGDLKVRAVSDNELLVEGRVEKKSDNSYCNNSFRRSFCLPNNSNIEGASSNLSSDGVLTIVVPKREESPLPIAYSIPVTVERKVQQRQVEKAEEKPIPVVIPLGYVDNRCTEKAPPSTAECIIPVQMESNAQSMSTTRQVANTNQSQESVTKTESQLQNIQVAESNQSNISAVIDEQSKTKESTVPVFMGAPPTAGLPQGTIAGHVERDIEKILTDTTSECQERVSKTDIKTGSTPILLEQTSRKGPQSDIQPGQMFTPRIVPITVRGDFYNDSVFDAAKEQVSSAVKNAMNRSLSQEGHQMHPEIVEKETIDMSDTTGTSTVLDEIHSYKIILDVFGFQEKDIVVRAVSKNELLVEGTMEQQKGNSITQHSFQRTFHLPDNIIIEESSSALSVEGMLTITVPKKVSTDQEILSSVSKTMTSESIETQLSNLSKQMDQIGNIADAAVQSNKIGEYIQPTNVEPSIASQTIRKDTEEIQNKSSQTSGTESIQVDKNISSSVDNKILPKGSLSKDLASETCFDLPVMKRGNFFQDSFFNDSRDTFECALRNAMGRFRSFSSFSDDLDFYKNLREEKFAGQNVATGISDDQNFKKVVVDVKGYPQDRIKVKVIEGNGILVEGKMEEKMDAGFSTKSFRRTFFLPPDYNLNAASSAMSMDGILNIKVPRTPIQSSLTN